jgi:K(+)-stimulated pyrophosphate-energized sodium pump
VELGVSLTNQQGPMLGHILSAVCFLISVFFVRRSFYGMRIESAN